jgi:preprotein translocase subunit SecB
MQHLKSIFKEIAYDLYFNLHKIQNGGNMVQTKLTQILFYNFIYLCHILYMYARKLVKRHSSFVEIPARRLNNIHVGYMFTAH